MSLDNKVIKLLNSLYKISILTIKEEKTELINVRNIGIWTINILYLSIALCYLKNYYFFDWVLLKIDKITYLYKNVNQIWVFS